MTTNKFTSPAAYRAVLSCGHAHVFSDEKVHNPDEKRRGQEDQFYCDKCANGDRSGYGEEGFCTRSLYHPVIAATPIFNRQYSEELRKKQQQAPKS